LAGPLWLGFQLAFDVTGDPEFPERAAFEVARDLGVPVTTHAGVWGATNDDGIALMHENGVLIKNDASPVMFPLLNPYGHVAFQAQRADVHTVVVNGRVVKHAHELIGADLAKARRVIGQTVEHLMSELGPDTWTDGMHPEIPRTEIRDNPYTYTTWDAGSAQWKK